MTATAAAGKEVTATTPERTDRQRAAAATRRKTAATTRSTRSAWPAGDSPLHNRGPAQPTRSVDDGDRPDLDRSETRTSPPRDRLGRNHHLRAGRAGDNRAHRQPRADGGASTAIRHGPDRRGTPHVSRPRTRPSLTPHTSVPSWPKAASVANRRHWREPMNRHRPGRPGPATPDHRRADGRRTHHARPRHRRRAGRIIRLPGRGYQSPGRAVRADRRGARRHGQFGVNLFAPNPVPVNPTEYRRYRDESGRRPSGSALTCRTSRRGRRPLGRQDRRPARPTRPGGLVHFRPARPRRRRRAASRRQHSGADRHVGGRGTAGRRCRHRVLIVQSVAAGGHWAHSPRIARRPSCRCPSCSPASTTRSGFPRSPPAASPTPRTSRR